MQSKCHELRESRQPRAHQKRKVERTKRKRKMKNHSQKFNGSEVKEGRGFAYQKKEGMRLR